MLEKSHEKPRLKLMRGFAIMPRLSFRLVLFLRGQNSRRAHDYSTVIEVSLRSWYCTRTGRYRRVQYSGPQLDCCFFHVLLFTVFTAFDDFQKHK